jgi:hypothetical protein
VTAGARPARDATTRRPETPTLRDRSRSSYAIVPLVALRVDKAVSTSHADAAQPGGVHSINTRYCGATALLAGQRSVPGRA